MLKHCWVFIFRYDPRIAQVSSCTLLCDNFSSLYRWENVRYIMYGTLGAFVCRVNICWCCDHIISTHVYSVSAGCIYGPGQDCPFPCHCAGDCDTTRGCDVGDTCESLEYHESLDPNYGETFSGPQCQIGELYFTLGHNSCVTDFVKWQNKLQ